MINGTSLDVLLEPWVLGVLGLLVGSFLNVVIHRVPLRQSIVSPGSHCPKCRHAVRPYDNVPVLSWLLLRGKCRDCKEPFSVRYPAVEALTGIVFFVGTSLVADPLTLAITLVFAASMIVVTLIDLDHMIIPDSITLPGIVIGIAVAFFGGFVDPKQAMAGMLVGGGGLFAVATAYRAATGRDGLGGGDVKLLGMVGAFLGPAGAFMTIMIGSIAGTLFAVVFMLRSGQGRTAELPFGTFLAPGAVISMLLGSQIIDAYWGFFS